MTAQEHSSAIALKLVNGNVNQLIAELAAKCEENDALKAQVAALTPAIPAKPAEAP